MIELAGSNNRAYRKSLTLRDGTKVSLRAIRWEDEDKWQAFVKRLKLHTLYLRFHYTLAGLTERDAKYFCHVDYENSYALVAATGEGEEEEIIAIARYSRAAGADTAEVAFVVEEDYQGKGLATVMLEELAVMARRKGIRIFEALVLAENREMKDVFHHSGFRISEVRDSGEYRIVMDISAPPGGRGF